VDHSALLLRQNDADCAFYFKGQAIFGHRFILEICCPNLFLVATNTKYAVLMKKKIHFVVVFFGLLTGNFFLSFSILYFSPNQLIVLVDSVRKKSSQAKARPGQGPMMAIEIDEKRLPVAPKTIVTLLKFVYSGNVNFFRLDILEVFELLIAAKTYELANLVLVCLSFFFFSACVI
jgi:hypothetical protein